MKLLKLLMLRLLFSALALQAETLTVIATGLENNHREVQFFIYNKDGTIPDKERIYQKVDMPLICYMMKITTVNLIKVSSLQKRV